MACGDKYKTLFTVKNWGDAGPWSKPRTWDDPWSASPGPIDFRNWRNAANRATDVMWDALEQLGQIETDLGKGWPKWNELNNAAALIYNRRNDLPHLISLDLEGPSREAVQIVKDAACALEEINDAIEGYGSKPITRPGPKDKGAGGGGGGGGGSWWDALIPYAVVLGIGAGAWYLDRNSGDEDEGGGG